MVHLSVSSFNIPKLRPIPTLSLCIGTAACALKPPAWPSLPGNPWGSTSYRPQCAANRGNSEYHRRGRRAGDRLGASTSPAPCCKRAHRGRGGAGPPLRAHRRELTPAEFANLTFVHEDFLKFNLNTLPEARWKVVANIPYYITTPILEKLLLAGPQRFSDLYVLDANGGRHAIMAEGQRDSGALTHFIGWHAIPEALLTFGGHVFMPRPRSTPRWCTSICASTPPDDADSKLLFRIVHAAFEHRRKCSVARSRASATKP